LTRPSFADLSAISSTKRKFETVLDAMAFVRASVCVALVAAVAAMPQDLRPRAMLDGVQSEPVSLIFDRQATTVNPGESLKLDCGVSGHYRYCHWVNGATPQIQVQDVHDGLISGLSAPHTLKGNECGIVLDSVSIEAHGPWTCTVYVKGGSIQATRNVTVTIRPTAPVLEVPQRPMLVDEGETRSVTCSVAAARPKVDIRWFLGEEELTYNSHVENSLTDDVGIYKSLSTLSHTFKAWNNMKTLRCEVSHYTLETPIEDLTDVIVRYKPFGRDVSIYGAQAGSLVEARVNFSANPQVTDLAWGYGPDFNAIVADIPVPGEEGRYSTEMMPLGDELYSVFLRIIDYEDIDSRMFFKLRVSNDIGSRDFRIIASNEKPPSDEVAGQQEVVAPSPDSEPQEPMSASSIVGIVIAVLLVLFVVLAAVYMKLNRLYCFGPKKEADGDDKEVATTNSDTESAEAPAAAKKRSAADLFSKLQTGLRKGKDSKKESEEDVTKGEEAPPHTTPPPPVSKDAQV